MNKPAVIAALGLSLVGLLIAELTVGDSHSASPAHQPTPSSPVRGVGVGATREPEPLIASLRKEAAGGDATAKVPSSAMGEDAPTERWTPDPGSPISLLDPEEWWSQFEPTVENMAKAIRGVPKFADLTDAQLIKAWETEGFQEAWRLNREALALRVFATGYTLREFERWESGHGSVALETELEQVAGFIATLPNPEAVWAAVAVYSGDVINNIHKHGESSPNKDDVPSKWKLFGVLTDQSKAATDFIEKVLEET